MGRAGLLLLLLLATAHGLVTTDPPLPDTSTTTGDTSLSVSETGPTASETGPTASEQGITTTAAETTEASLLSAFNNPFSRNSATTTTTMAVPEVETLAAATDSPVVTGELTPAQLTSPDANVTLTTPGLDAAGSTTTETLNAGQQQKEDRLAADTTLPPLLPSTTAAPTETTNATTNATEPTTEAATTNATAATDTNATETTTAAANVTALPTETTAAQETTTVLETTAAQETTTVLETTTEANLTTELNATAEVNATETTVAETNATEVVFNATTTTTAPTTTTVTTTESLPLIQVILACTVKIGNMEFQAWMNVKIMQAYQDFVAKVIAAVTPALRNKFGDAFISVEVVALHEGSVIVDLDVKVQTNKTSPDEVDSVRLAAETSEALQQVIEVGDFTFDPAAVAVSDEIQVIEPTTTPAPTEDPYQWSILRFSMRAPNANYTEDMNDTESAIFAEMDADVERGVREMLIKKYPPENWNVTAVLEKVRNDTEEGLWIDFVVTVAPQWYNTTKEVAEMGKNYVYFNRLGSLQIDPSSVTTKDMTTYAPGLGVVIMDEDYRKELRKALYNGSFVGDYSTPRPTLRPIVKRHKTYVMTIALPAFLGMLATLGLLLICTTITGSKTKSI